MTASVNPVQASKAVLIEVMNVLGLYRDHLILVGGWVPELLFPDRGHIGSLDVDLAVDVRGISKMQYDTILQRLLDAGYKRKPNCFLRTVKGAQEPVKLDLITGEYIDGTATDVRARLQEIHLGKLRGADLAFEVFDEISMTGVMPDGSTNTVKLRIVRIEAFIIMKAFAMSERTKGKDAYDIYFCLKHFPDGIEGLARLYRHFLQNKLVQEGLALLRDKFGSINSVGPIWAAQVAEENGTDPDLARRDTFQLMKGLLDAIEANREGKRDATGSVEIPSR